VTVSWLELERFALGELDPERRRGIEAALAADPSLRARLASIEADSRPLPSLPGLADDLPLPADSGEPLPDPDAGGEVVVLRRWRPLLGGAALLAAAAAALVVQLPNTASAEFPAPSTTWKGGELSLRLDRARAGSVRAGATRFVDGDRIAVRLTCPPGARPWDLAVYQAGEAFFPLDTADDITCGNLVALPGAFLPTGPDALIVCAAVGEAADRGALDEGLAALTGVDGVVCQRLEPGG